MSPGQLCRELTQLLVFPPQRHSAFPQEPLCPSSGYGMPHCQGERIGTFRVEERLYDVEVCGMHGPDPRLLRPACKRVLLRQTPQVEP